MAFDGSSYSRSVEGADSSTAADLANPSIAGARLFTEDMETPV